MRARHRTMIAAGLLIGSVPAGAQARRPSTPVRQPQIGGIAPAPGAAPRDEGGRREHRRDGDGRHHDGGRGYAPGSSYAPVSGIYGWVPAVIGADGRVWVDLGYGYEQVMRSCGAQDAGYVTAYQPDYAQPTYTPPSYSAPTYTPPSYSSPSYPAPLPTGSAGATQPAPDPSSHAPPGMAPAPGTPPAPGASPAPAAGRTMSYSYPPRGHRGVPSCYSPGQQGKLVALWR